MVQDTIITSFYINCWTVPILHTNTTGKEMWFIAG